MGAEMGARGAMVGATGLRAPETGLCAEGAPSGGVEMGQVCDLYLVLRTASYAALRAYKYCVCTMPQQMEGGYSSVQ